MHLCEQAHHLLRQTSLFPLSPPRSSCLHLLAVHSRRRNGGDAQGERERGEQGGEKGETHSEKTKGRYSWEMGVRKEGREMGFCSRDRMDQRGWLGYFWQ